MIYFMLLIIWASTRVNRSSWGGGGGEQQRRSLISAFVICLLCDTLPRLELDDDCKALAGLIIGQLKISEYDQEISQSHRQTLTP